MGVGTDCKRLDGVSRAPKPMMSGCLKKVKAFVCA